MLDIGARVCDFGGDPAQGAWRVLCHDPRANAEQLAGFRFPFEINSLEPLAKLTLQGDFSLLWAKAGGAGGHFWHDTVTETNIITPAKWILPNAN
ncbi:MAG: hypothetical protein NOF05_15095 [Candidatus Accumulibacter phosphatis]|nr:hypothetical protein [Candidatus Accumulibacter phosphatis]